MSSGGQIVILLSKHSTGIKSHFDTRIILILFSIPKIREKQTLHVRIMRILNIYVLNSWKFNFVSKSMRQANNIAWKRAFPTMFVFTPLRYLSWRICAKGHLRPLSKFVKIWPCCTSVNLIQNGFCWHLPHLLMLSHKLLCLNYFTAYQN